MANTSQQTILTAFNQASGDTEGHGTVASGQALSDALAQATQVIDAQTQATAQNTDALAQNSQSKSTSSGGTASDVMNVASSLLGGGLSAIPLVSLFTSLFSGGEQQDTPLSPFSLPPAINLQTTSNEQAVTWGENGLPRQTGGGGERGFPDHGASASNGQPIFSRSQR